MRLNTHGAAASSQWACAPRHTRATGSHHVSLWPPRAKAGRRKKTMSGAPGLLGLTRDCASQHRDALQHAYTLPHTHTLIYTDTHSPPIRTCNNSRYHIFHPASPVPPQRPRETKQQPESWFNFNACLLHTVDLVIPKKKKKTLHVWYLSTTYMHSNLHTGSKEAV